MPRPVSGNARENVVSTRLSDVESQAVQAQAGGNRSAWLRQAVRYALGIAPMGQQAPPLPKREGPAPQPKAPRRKSRPLTRTVRPRPDPGFPKPESPPAELEQPHRHKRERVGDHWVGGSNVGKWACSTCGAELGVFQS